MYFSRVGYEKWYAGEFTLSVEGWVGEGDMRALPAGKSEIITYVAVHSFSFAGDATSSIVTTGDHANREPTRVLGRAARCGRRTW